MLVFIRVHDLTLDLTRPCPRIIEKGIRFYQQCESRIYLQYVHYKVFHDGFWHLPCIDLQWLARDVQ